METRTGKGIRIGSVNMRKTKSNVPIYRGAWGISSFSMPKWWNSIFNLVLLDYEQDRVVVETKIEYLFDYIVNANEVKFRYKFLVIGKEKMLHVYLVPIFSELNERVQEQIISATGYDRYNFILRKFNQNVNTIWEYLEDNTVLPEIRYALEYKDNVFNGDEVNEEIGVLLTQIGLSLGQVSKTIFYELSIKKEDQEQSKIDRLMQIL